MKRKKLYIIIPVIVLVLTSCSNNKEKLLEKQNEELTAKIESLEKQQVNDNQSEESNNTKSEESKSVSSSANEIDEKHKKAEEDVKNLISSKNEIYYKNNEKVSNINGKDYFVFYERSKEEKITSQKRYCVSVDSGEIFVQDVAGKFIAYNEYKQQIETNKKNTENKSQERIEFKNSIFGHWVNQYDQHDWFSPKTWYSKGKTTKVHSEQYEVITDLKEINSILDGYRGGTIYLSGSDACYDFNIPDRYINRSIILKSKNRGTDYNCLIVFSEDRKLYESFLFDFPSKGNMLHQGKHHYYDDVQVPN